MGAFLVLPSLGREAVLVIPRTIQNHFLLVSLQAKSTLQARPHLTVLAKLWLACRLASWWKSWPKWRLVPVFRLVPQSSLSLRPLWSHIQTKQNFFSSGTLNSPMPYFKPCFWTRSFLQIFWRECSPLPEAQVLQYLLQQPRLLQQGALL